MAYVVVTCGVCTCLTRPQSYWRYVISLLPFVADATLPKPSGVKVVLKPVSVWFVRKPVERS
jgi:hypothetical protein